MVNLLLVVATVVVQKNVKGNFMFWIRGKNVWLDIKIRVPQNYNKFNIQLKRMKLILIEGII